MAKSASDIVNRALTLIDEVVTTFDTAATTETSIRNQALEILPEVCRDLVKELPWDLKRYLAESGNLQLGGTDNQDYHKRKVTLIPPPDFWELVAIKLGVWGKPVTKYIYIDSESYPKQNNPFTRAGKQNPVVALSNRSTSSGLTIECFSIPKDQVNVDIALFEYIKFTNVPDDDGNTWPDELFDEITKALATELNIIKSRTEAAVIRSEEVDSAISQHE